MRILHLFNWPLKEIIPYLEQIHNQGFDVIQINPIQPLKDENSDEWWMSYQPVDFKIGNKFGSRDDLVKLCTEAHKYDIKIVADVICNHMAGKDNGETSPHEKIPDYLRNRPEFWKDRDIIHDWGNRYDVTHKSMPGLPGLNCYNVELQFIIADFLNSLIDCGVDGFRFDAAKNIALPREYGCKFWDNVLYCLKKYGLIIYGEVLNDYPSILNGYADYMKVLTDGYTGDYTKSIKYPESHDSYLGFRYTDRESSKEIGDRYADFCRWFPNTLFYARPFDNEWQSETVKKGNKVYIK